MGYAYHPRTRLACPHGFAVGRVRGYPMIQHACFESVWCRKKETVVESQHPHSVPAGREEWCTLIRREPFESFMYPKVNSALTSLPSGDVKK